MSHLIDGPKNEVDLVHGHEDKVDLVHRSDDEVDLVHGHEKEVHLVASTTRSRSTSSKLEGLDEVSGV